MVTIQVDEHGHKETAITEPAQTVTTYLPRHADIVHRNGRVYLFDSSTSRIIAEVDLDAADAIRHHRPVLMKFDGQTLSLDDPTVTLENPA